MPEPLNELSEEGLIAADRHQRRVMGSGDEQGMARLLHPNFIINAPHNISGAREQVLLLSEDALAYENCHSQIEKTSLTGNVGIVMGSETVTPAEGSLLAAWFGTAPVRRRFTDVYVFEDGKWLLLGRQASVVREAKKFVA
jgi:hypothetical protein